jgi:4a-hydroxytetrahydrobiopterin dehydratase
MTKLSEQHCLPQAEGAMTPYEIGKHLQTVVGWSLVDGSIEKTFSFANYHETIGFVNAVAWIANREDHHPDLAVSFDRCAVRFNTHSVGGISLNDFICAAKLDALLT